MTFLLQEQIEVFPRTKTEQFFAHLYAPYMQMRPRRSRSLFGSKRRNQERQWVFFGSPERMRSVATLSSLFAMLADPQKDTTYFTPNGYYRRDQRLTESLRWLNAFVFDLDHCASLVDVFEAADLAGLPRPTAVVRTPSGGHHVYYFFTRPIRATRKAIGLYSAIMRHMAIDLGADLAAIGANRIFRTPTDHTLVYFEPENRYDFDFFVTWRDINHPFDPMSGVYVETSNIMQHPALQHLLHAPCPIGKRETTAFNLILAMKASEWPQERALQAMRDWYNTCCEKGGKKPFTERDVVYKVEYVYRKPNLRAPSAEVIRELSGMAFHYRVRRAWQGAKPRSERVRSHLYEWEADLIDLLKREKELAGTQKELAALISCPFSTFRIVLERLKGRGIITLETRRGRGGLTIVRLSEALQTTAQDNVIVFPQPEKREPKSALKRDTVIVRANFMDKRILSIERLPAAEIEPDESDFEPPD